MVELRTVRLRDRWFVNKDIRRRELFDHFAATLIADIMHVHCFDTYEVPA